MRKLLLVITMAIATPGHAQVTASDMLDMCEQENSPYYLACVYWFNGAITTGAVMETVNRRAGYPTLFCANTYDEQGIATPPTPKALLQIWLRYVDKNPDTIAKDGMRESYLRMMMETFPCDE